MPAKRATYYDKVGGGGFVGREVCLLTTISLQTEPVQNMPLKVWSLYADLEESLGTFEVSLVMVM